MADENIYLDIVNGIVTTLRNNISDPANRGSPFIYPDFPRVDATMPRISITAVGGDISGAGLNHEFGIFNLRLQIDVWCSIHGSYTISNIKYGNTKLRDYLAGMVTKVLWKNRSNLGTYNILDVAPIIPFRSLDSGEEDLVRGSGDFVITYWNNFT